MSGLTITFETDNAAFGSYPAAEIASILAGIGNRVRDEQATSGTVTRPIRDSNGNTVGSWTWTHEAPDSDDY